jgi:hypothetical protein
LIPDDIPNLVEYVNIPRPIGAVVSARMATLVECDTVYSAEDIYLILEVMQIDGHNRRMARKAAEDAERNK